jgi:hypothetical protein
MSDKDFDNDGSDIADLTSADDRSARKLQIAMMNAIYKQIMIDPLNVSSTLLAVAERMLARYNMGLIDIQEDEEMTEDEIKMVEEFEKLNVHLDADGLVN